MGKVFVLKKKVQMEQIVLVQLWNWIRKKHISFNK